MSGHLFPRDTIYEDQLSESYEKLLAPEKS